MWSVLQSIVSFINLTVALTASTESLLLTKIKVLKSQL